MLLDFSVYLTVRSVEQLDLGGESAVLVKATQRPKGDIPWRGGDVSLFFVCAPGHAPTPGDVMKVAVAQTEAAVPVNTKIYAAATGWGVVEVPPED